MKILFLSHAQYITVALPKIIEQAEVLSTLGNDVTIVATSKKNRWRIDTFQKNGVNYIITPSILFGKLRHGADLYDALRRIIYLTRNFNFDIIHAIDSRPAVILPALYLKRKKRIPLVLEWSDLYSDGGTIKERSSLLYYYTFGKVEAFFETRFRNYADGATGITNYLKKKIIEKGFDENKVLIHRMGSIVDKNKIMAKSLAREKLNFSNSEIFIGHLGKIYPRDHELLVESFCRILQNNPNASLLFIGNVDQKLQIKNDKVKYLGFLNHEKFNLYCNAIDFFVLPLKENKSNSARWPSKIGDYFSYGKPVLATGVGDLKDIFNDHKIGILSEDTPLKFAESLQEMINKKASWNLFGKNALDYSAQNLDWIKICSSLVKFYDKIIALN